MQTTRRTYTPGRLCQRTLSCAVACVAALSLWSESAKQHDQLSPQKGQRVWSTCAAWSASRFIDQPAAGARVGRWPCERQHTSSGNRKLVEHTAKTRNAFRALHRSGELRPMIEDNYLPHCPSHNHC